MEASEANVLLKGKELKIGFLKREIAPGSDERIFMSRNSWQTVSNIPPRSSVSRYFPRKNLETSDRACN